MVKLTTLLSVILLSLYSFTHAQETKVSFDIALNGNYEPDSIYFLFHPTVEIEAGGKYPNPKKTLTISEKAGKVVIEPGIYTMTVLAQDKEPDLRKYIADNNIRYPNALASKNLLAKYGITKYPTSFLINPDGKITRIDVRGEDAMNLLKDEINNYFR